MSWQEDLLAVLPEAPGLIVWDIDWTVANGMYADMVEFKLRPGIGEVIRDLAAQGHEQRFWSAGGAEHALSVAQVAGLTDIVVHCHRKPPHPMQPEAVRALVGRLPDLIIDDDFTQRVAGCRFFRIPPFTLVDV